MRCGGEGVSCMDSIMKRHLCKVSSTLLNRDSHVEFITVYLYVIDVVFVLGSLTLRARQQDSHQKENPFAREQDAGSGERDNQKRNPSDTGNRTRALSAPNRTGEVRRLRATNPSH